MDQRAHPSLICDYAEAERSLLRLIRTQRNSHSRRSTTTRPEVADCGLKSSGYAKNMLVTTGGAE